MHKGIGIVCGESSISTLQFSVDPNSIPKFGEFVVTKNRDGEWILCVVSDMINTNPLADEVSFNSLSKAFKRYAKTFMERGDVLIAKAKILGIIEEKNGKIDVKPNRVPVKPGEFVYLAEDDTLRKIFSKEAKHVEIGTLLTRESIPVTLDLHNLATRHFAILAVTGAGKSNTVAVITQEIVNKIGGTVIIVDPHGEYQNLSFNGKGNKVKVIPTKIRPENLSPAELASLLKIPEQAILQSYFLEIVYETIKHENPDVCGVDFIKAIYNKIVSWIDAKGSIEYYDALGTKRRRKIDSRDLNSLIRVQDQIITLLRRYASILSEIDILSEIKEGYANILSLSGLEEEQMIAIVAYMLRKILTTRIKYKSGSSEEKRFIEKMYPALTKPVLIIIEEAHIFTPRDSKNEASFWISKIAREGRKFGVGLGVVSQRPKKLDGDVLSQCNTKIILRLLEPTDQRYVQQASEQLSEDLLKDIAALGVGEAIIVGSAIKLPVAVRIKKFEGEYGGEDLNIYEEWSMKREPKFDIEDIV